MAAAADADAPAWLPAGWVVHNKVTKNGHKVRSYTNSETGKKFYSKNAVISHLNTRKTDYGTPHTSKKSTTCHSGNKHPPLLEYSNKIPNWLPKGWIVEVKTRKRGFGVGKIDKYYTEPLSGVKFNSKQEVFRYLEDAMCSSCHSNKMQRSNSGHYVHYQCSNRLKEPEASKHLNIKCSSSKYKRRKINRKVVVEKVEAVGLPPGWIKEIKIKRCQRGIRKDPYYTDPVSGCIFRSKIDALRYLETGEVSKHVIVPKKRLTGDKESKKDGIPPSSAAERQKLLTHQATMKPHFAGALPEGEGSYKKQSAEIMTVTNLTAESVQEMHSADNGTKRGADIFDLYETSNSTLLKARDSNRRGKKDFAGKLGCSTQADVLEEKTALEHKNDPHNEMATNKSNKRELNISCRFSKRLAGLKPELFANLDSGERTLSRRVRSSKPEATTAPSMEDRTDTHDNKKELSVPRRTSKRLKGLGHELLTNLDSGERALIRSTRSSKHEATPAPSMDDEASQQPEVKPETELLIENSDYKEALVEGNLLEMHLLDRMPDGHTESKELTYANNSDLPNARASNESRDKDFAENMSVSTRGDVLEEKVTLLKKKVDTCKRKTTNNKNKDREFNIPRRFSKRLAGVCSEPSAEGSVSERSGKSEAPQTPTINCKASQQPEAMLVIDGSDAKEPFVEAEASTENKKIHKAQAAAPDEQLEKLEAENKDQDQQETESQSLFTLVNSWSDPCLEFAFKTLTGEIPIEDDLAIQDYFKHQPDTSCAPSNGDLAWLTDIGEKPAVKQEQPTQHTVLPPECSSLPSCSAASLCQPSVEPNRESHIKY